MNSKAKVQEIWKTIKDYPNYQVSDLGNVKSLNRIVRSKGGFRNINERVLKPHANSKGYLGVSLSKNNIKKTKVVHQLVAIAFLNYKPDGTHKIVVDHKNNKERYNNSVDNLQLITGRENISKDRTNGTSEYTGVSWVKHCRKWKAEIRIDKKHKYLGLFVKEYDAHIAYQNKLKEYNKWQVKTEVLT